MRPARPPPLFRAPATEQAHVKRRRNVTMLKRTLPAAEDLPGLRADGTGTPYSGVPQGLLDWSQFDPELLARNIALREGNEKVLLHPAGCGPCQECIDFIWMLGNEKIKAEYSKRELAFAEGKHSNSIDAS